MVYTLGELGMRLLANLGEGASEFGLPLSLISYQPQNNMKGKMERVKNSLRIYHPHRGSKKLRDLRRSGWRRCVETDFSRDFVDTESKSQDRSENR